MVGATLPLVPSLLDPVEPLTALVPPADGVKAAVSFLTASADMSSDDAAAGAILGATGEGGGGVREPEEPGECIGGVIAAAGWTSSTDDAALLRLDDILGG